MTTSTTRRVTASLIRNVSYNNTTSHWQRQQPEVSLPASYGTSATTTLPLSDNVDNQTCHCQPHTERQLQQHYLSVTTSTTRRVTASLIRNVSYNNTTSQWQRQPPDVSLPASYGTSATTTLPLSDNVDNQTCHCQPHTERQLQQHYLSVTTSTTRRVTASLIRNVSYNNTTSQWQRQPPDVSLPASHETSATTTLPLSDNVNNQTCHCQPHTERQLQQHYLSVTTSTTRRVTASLIRNVSYNNTTSQWQRQPPDVSLPASYGTSATTTLPLSDNVNNQTCHCQPHTERQLQQHYLSVTTSTTRRVTASLIRNVSYNNTTSQWQRQPSDVSLPASYGTSATTTLPLSDNVKHQTCHCQPHTERQLQQHYLSVTTSTTRRVTASVTRDVSYNNTTSQWQLILFPAPIETVTLQLPHRP